MLAVSRDLKVADFVRDEVARIIQMEMRDPRVGMFVSVNDVRVSKDLSYAEIYVSSLEAQTEEEKAELIGVLNKASGFFRSTLAKRHTMRTTPKPRFHYDALVETAPRLEKLIGDAVAADDVVRARREAEESAKALDPSLTKQDAANDSPTGTNDGST